MKVYKLVVMVIDHDAVGADGIAEELHCANYGNDCIAPKVMSCEERDIGKWEDSNPLNHRDEQAGEFKRLFEADANPVSDSAIASLRHLYTNMTNGAVRDTASANRIATGLLGPIIEQLERKNT